MDHIIRSEHIKAPQYKDATSRALDIRLMVKGARNIVGYRVGYVPAGCSARQVDGGPLVPGPWAFSFGCAAVIDRSGGSRADIDRERDEGRLIEANAGDRLIIDGVAYRIDFHPHGREWLTLTRDQSL